MNCKNCNTEMEHISEDEGGMVIEWCPKCGTLLTHMCDSLDGDWSFPEDINKS